MWILTLKKAFKFVQGCSKIQNLNQRKVSNTKNSKYFWFSVKRGFLFIILNSQLH